MLSEEVAPFDWTLGDDDVNEPLLGRLRAHRSLHEVPQSELEWLAAHGVERAYAAGEVAVRKGEMPPWMQIVLSGHWAIHVDRGAGARRMLEWKTGDIAGMLPFSRLTQTPGNVEALEPTETLTIDRSHFPELIRECPGVVGVCVHAMLDRARVFNTNDLHDEKLVSMGRLAAGLAHELNNPASAAARGAKLLAAAVDDLAAASRGLGALSLSVLQDAQLDALREQLAALDATAVSTPIERADREESIDDWLQAHGLDSSLAGALAQSALPMEALDEVAKAFHGAALTVVVRWVAALLTAHALTRDISSAAARLSQLVSAVKGFTYMDRTPELEPVDFKRSIGDTLAMLSSKIRDKKADVTLTIEHAVPEVRAYGSELNQVWMNLLDNALDAIAAGGKIEVVVSPQGSRVVVHVRDNGCGIPADARSRVFDPFFTTKPVGQGTGLGLDISRRLVRRVGGEIDVESEPGRTDFRVSLPVAALST